MSDLSRADSMLSVDPSAIASLSAEQKERLAKVLDQYLLELEGGVPPHPEELMRAHPDLARPLGAYLTSLAQLHAAALDLGAPAPRAPAPRHPDWDERQLGDFALGRVIGRGGMGIVYEARQLSLGKRVAVKILPFAAVLDAKQIARFKNEAQAAAQLQHPNIVPVFAVGVDRGVHYYAMQLIDGEPLDRIIAALRGDSAAPEDDDATRSFHSDDTSDVGDHLSRRSACDSSLFAQRSRRRDYFRSVIRLGIQAAEALQAAHAYGIVHRDIKPSNLLLDDDNKLWITDFGLARCESELALTKTGDVVGTRRYMSPEQASGEAALIDQRTDIYSLAATIYELLTLRPAYRGDDLLARRLGDPYEPIRPRHIDPLIPLDLETVVLKGMAKLREERYLTAQELADDLRRVLEGKPIVARPPTLADRANKWTRRHGRLVASLATVGVLAVVGLAASALLIHREKIVAQHNLRDAEQNFEQADRNFRLAKDAVDRLGSRVAERLSGIPGAEGVRRELLEETLRYHQDFARRAAQDSSLQIELAQTYSKMGTLAEEAGSSDESIAAHADAVRVLEKLVAEQPRVADYRRRLGISQNNLAQALGRAGRADDALRTMREAIELQTHLVADDLQARDYAADLALSHNNLGMLQGEAGATDEAEREFREAIRLQEALAAAADAGAENWRDLATTCNNLAALISAKDSDAAAAWYQKAATWQAKAVAARPGDRKFESALASIFNNMGAADAHLGRQSEAAVAYARAIDMQRRLVDVAPTNRFYRRDLAVSQNNLGLTQSKLHQPHQAEQSFRAALTTQELLVTQNPTDIELVSSLGGIYNNLGFVQEELRQPDAAVESYRRAVECQARALEKAPGVDRYRGFLSKHYYNYGRALRITGHADEAARTALRRKELWPRDPERLLSVAEELSLASQALSFHDASAAASDECAAQAITTLREAVAAGLKTPSALTTNESLAPLRKYSQFTEIVHP